MEEAAEDSVEEILSVGDTVILQEDLTEMDNELYLILEKGEDSLVDSVEEVELVEQEAKKVKDKAIIHLDSFLIRLIV
jgi:hypothetical protein